MISRFIFFFSLILFFSLSSNFQEVEQNEENITDQVDEVERDNGVYILTDENFKKFISREETILVKFYAPWCAHCKSLAPKYEEAAQTLEKEEQPILLAKLDATENKNSAQEYNIMGYPTLIAFKNGVSIDYEGGRTSEDIVKKMKEIAGPDFKMPSSSVLTLTAQNFSQITDEAHLVAVMFYAPWCGHCKSLKPHWEKAAKDLASESPPILLAKVDATEEKTLASNFNIKGYPSIKIFRKGKVFEYKNDDRTSDGIRNYMLKQAGSASQEVRDMKTFKHLVTHPLDSTFTIFPLALLDKKEPEIFEIYLEAAENLRDEVTFYYSTEEEHMASFKSPKNSLIIFRNPNFQTKYEPTHHNLQLTKETKLEEIIEFVKKQKIPLLGEFNSATKEKIFGDVKKPFLIFFFTVDWGFDGRDATQLWRRKFADIAAKNKDLVSVVADEEKNIDLFNVFGFDDSGEEINVGILTPEGRKYPMAPLEEYDQDEIQRFIEKFRKGKLKPKIKSQAIPSKQSGPVVVVVGKTFEKIVYGSNKDVLIEFYAPWCGHCKSLEPIYKELATKLKGRKNLIIAKMDVTANDAPPSFSIDGFPKIYLIPAGEKENPILFSGDRNIDEFSSFLKTNCKVAFNSGKDEL